MQIVIDMPDNEYILVKNLDDFHINRDNIVSYVRNGIPLPKGHGRLFILDEGLVKEFFTSFSFSCQKWISEVGISNATLKVIEADTESDNEHLSKVEVQDDTVIYNQ